MPATTIRPIAPAAANPESPSVDAERAARRLSKRFYRTTMLDHLLWRKGPSKSPRFAQRKAITLECGLQNSTIGLTIAITILGNTVISIPIAVYGLLMLFTGFGYALAVQGRADGQ